MSLFASKMAGNPDQQEDTVDDQYQEEMEDEVHSTTSSTFFLHLRNIHFYVNSVSYVIVAVVKAQEDVTGGQKRDGEVEEEEDPYNEENLEQVGSRRV